MLPDCTCETGVAEELCVLPDCPGETDVAADKLCVLPDCPGETGVDDELFVLSDCPGETGVDDKLCVAVCPGETVVVDEPKSSISGASSRRTRVIWHSSIAAHSASNMAPGSVHRDSKVPHRDVTHSQSRAARSQREAVTDDQETLSAVGQSRGGFHDVAEHFKPQVHSSTSVHGSENCSVRTSCTGTVKQSCVGVELTDSDDSLSSHCRSKAVHSKCKVNDERRTSDAVLNQHGFSDKSKTDAQTYVKCDMPSDVKRSEWKSMSDARASVSGCHQSQIVSGHEVSIDSGHCKVTDSGRKQHSKVASQQQQSADVRRPERLHGWSDGVSKPESLSGSCDDVSKSERLHGWSEGVSKPESFSGWSDSVSKPEKLRGWSDGVSKPGKFRGCSSSGTSRHGQLRL